MPRPSLVCSALLASVALVAGCRDAPAGGATPETAVRRDVPSVDGAALLVMSTDARLVVYADTASSGDRALAAAMSRLHEIESTLNRYDPSSEIAALSSAAGQGPRAVSRSTARAVAAAQQWYRASDGAFNPLVGPLVDLWKQAAADDQLPDDASLTEALALLDFDRVEVALPDDAPATVHLPVEGMRLDLGGLAKGWAAQEALGAMRAVEGVRAALAVIGGDGACWAEPDWPRPWVFGVQHPVRTTPGELYTTVQLPRGAVVTSGGYYRSVEIQGRRYNHVLDPRTGRPVEAGVLSATVIHDDGAAADALATACLVLGPESSVALLARLGAEGLILARSGDDLLRYETAGFAAFEAGPAGGP